MLEKIQVFISILAALIVVIISMIKKISLAEMSVKLIIVICISYVAGLVLKHYLTKNVFVEGEKEPRKTDIQNTDIREAEDEQGDTEDLMEDNSREELE